MLGPDFAHWRLSEFNLMESQNKHAVANLAFVVENNTAVLLVYRKAHGIRMDGHVGKIFCKWERIPAMEFCESAIMDQGFCCSPIL